MEQSKSQGYAAWLLAILLFLIQILFQFKWLNGIFLVLMILMITAAFLSEKNRVLVWLIVSFSGGLLLFMYLDRLILALPYTQAVLLTLNRALLLVPIVLMSYILYKFKDKWFDCFKRPVWRKDKSVLESAPKKLFLIGTLILVLTLLGAILSSPPSSFMYIWNSISFAIINGVLIETLWRGIFLFRFQRLIGEKLAVFITSISSSIAYFMFGFSLTYCFLFFLIGIFLGLFTYETKSIYPAITWNILLTLILIFLDVIPLLLV